MPKLSVIVPVFNVEDYIEDCVKSILSQSFSDFELLLIDDGSTDKSRNICENLAKHDCRIKFFHQSNSGVSSARNLGLEKATGDRISFIDSDDVIEKDMYSKMLESDGDLIICGVREINHSSSIVHLYDLPSEVLFKGEDEIKNLIRSDFEYKNILNSPCNKIYKRNIISCNKLYFPNRKRGEDWWFNMLYVQKIKSFFFVNEPLYNYYRRDNSAMAKYLPEQFDLWLENRKLRNQIKDEFDIHFNESNYNRIWVEKVLYHLINTPKDYKDKVDEILANIEFIDACRNCSKLSSWWMNNIATSIANSNTIVAKAIIKLLSAYSR